MSVFVLIEFHAPSDKLDSLTDLLRWILPDTRAFDGCQEVVVRQDCDDPGTVVLCERWHSRTHYDSYHAWRVERGDLTGLGEIVDRRPSTRVFVELAT